MLFSWSRNESLVLSKPKSKKKPKKAKFKSLKKGALASELNPVKEEPETEMSIDSETLSDTAITSSDRVSPHSTAEKKRKAVSDFTEEKSKKSSKKVKKSTDTPLSVLDSNQLGKQQNEPKDSKLCESVIDLEHKQVSRSKMGGKMSITAMPVKRVLTIRLEKLKKKGSIWSKDCFPSPDSWLPQEDAILCAAVLEYGTHWSLVSEVLYGMTGGGFHRGIFRHPVHCCERFRELIQRYVFAAVDNLPNEKVSNASSGKALLKVTEVS